MKARRLPAQPRRTAPSRPLPIALRLLASLVGLALVGTLLLFVPGMTTRPLRVEEALFTAVSAVTVTGLSVINVAVDLTPLGHGLLAVLMQVGGLGVMMLAVVIFMLLGRRISLLDRVALRNTLGAVQPGAVLRLMQRVLLGVLLIEGAGAFLLYLTWRERLGDTRAAGYAIFHAISAFCNAGFDLFAGSPEFPGGLPNDAYTLSILSGLIFLGGLGVPVLADLLALVSGVSGNWLGNGVKRRVFLFANRLTGQVTADAEPNYARTLSLNTRLTLIVTVLLLLTGTVGLLIAREVEAINSSQALNPLYELGHAFFLSIAVRTAGISGIWSMDSLTPASQFLLMTLMFIGAAPASMGGGITTGTLTVLALTVWAYLRGAASPVVAQRSISSQVTRRASAVLVVSLLIVVMATWLLLLTHPQAQLIEAMFEVVSAFATCGLTLAFTSQLNGFGQVVVMLVMFWGRLGPLSVVAALARPPEQARVQYPEETILIG